MSRSEPTRPLSRDDLTTRELDGEFFLYDPVTDRVVLINHSAAVILELCDGTRTEDEIATEVHRLYDSEASQLDDEVRATLATFTTHGLFVRAPTSVRQKSDDPAE